MRGWHEKRRAPPFADCLENALSEPSCLPVALGRGSLAAPPRGASPAVVGHAPGPDLVSVRHDGAWRIYGLARDVAAEARRQGLVPG